MSENEENLEASEGEPEANIDQEVIRAIPITMTVEVGSTRLKLRDLLRLAQGSVLELDRSVGELMDVKAKPAKTIVKINALKKIKDMV